MRRDWSALGEILAAAGAVVLAAILGGFLP